MEDESRCEADDARHFLEFEANGDFVDTGGVAFAVRHYGAAADWDLVYEFYVV